MRERGRVGLGEREGGMDWEGVSEGKREWVSDR